MDGVLMDDFSISSYTGLDENQELEFNAFPNPVNDQLVITGVPKGISRLQILDITGRVLHEQILTKSNENLSMNSYNSGIYFVKITQNENAGIIKIIKN